MSRGLQEGDTERERRTHETNDGSVREPGDLTRGSSDSTSDVEDLHAGLETNVGREVVLVSGELQVRKRTERERPGDVSLYPCEDQRRSAGRGAGTWLDEEGRTAALNASPT